MDLNKVSSLILAISIAADSCAVSIAQLLQEGKIPAPQTTTVEGKTVTALNLSGLGIDSLEGLAQIPGIENVSVLALNDNNLKKIPAHGFTPCKKVMALGLERNNITEIEPFAFDKCAQLKSINLNHNNLSSFAPYAFAGPERLEVLSLNRNPGLTKNRKEIQRLKQELPHTKITTGPFTKKQWIAIGVTAATIAVAVAAAVGVGRARKKSPEPMPAGVQSSQEIIERVRKHSPTTYSFIKDMPIVGYTITSGKFEDIPEAIRQHIGGIDKTKYTEGFLNENVGTIIALQMKGDEPDFYIIDKNTFTDKYTPVSVDEVRTKNAKLIDKLSAVKGMADLLKQEGVTGALKKDPVKMIKMSEIGYPLDIAVTIQSPWGEQTKPAGKEAYLVFDATQGMYYMVNTGDDGNPLSYVPAQNR